MGSTPLQSGEAEVTEATSEIRKPGSKFRLQFRLFFVKILNKCSVL
jgi:hypothetical protein